MRRIMAGIAAATGGILAVACQQNAAPPPSPEEIQGIQIATDAYLAYQHADCETVYRLTQPDVIDAMQATELRYSLRLARGFCQEVDGDQPAARQTYHRIIDEGPSSFAAEDARERLRILDREVDDPDYLRRVEDAARRERPPLVAREPSVRTTALYPPLARAAAVEGFAVVEFGVAENGKTVDPIIVDSNPPFVFEGSALRAVREWIYKSQRNVDPDARSVIRIVFRTAVDPELIDGPGPEAVPETTATSEASATP
jgi:TonB family protein